MRGTRVRDAERHTYKKQLEVGRMLQGHCKLAVPWALRLSLPAKGCAVLGSRVISG